MRKDRRWSEPLATSVTAEGREVVRRGGFLRLGPRHSNGAGDQNCQVAVYRPAVGKSLLVSLYPN